MYFHNLLLLPLADPTPSPSPPSHFRSVALLPSSPVAVVALRNARRRRVKDKLAQLFICIVIVFMVCNTPRMALSLYETVELEKIHVSCSYCTLVWGRRFAFPLYVV